MDSQEPMTMEKILKKVYDVHRQTLAETNAKLSRYMTNHDRLEEQVKQLQADKENLLSDNRQLRTGDCCKVISNTLQTVTASYDQMLQEKDARIRELEAELRRRRRTQNTGYLEDSQDEPPEHARETRRHSRLPKQSPDSTSTVSSESLKDTREHSQSTPQLSQTKIYRKESVTSAALKKLGSSQNCHSGGKDNSQEKSSAVLKSKSKIYSSQVKQSCDSQMKDTSQGKNYPHDNSQENINLNDNIQEKVNLSDKSRGKNNLRGNSQGKSNFHENLQDKSNFHDNLQGKSNFNDNLQDKSNFHDNLQGKSNFNDNLQGNINLCDILQRKSKVCDNSEVENNVCAIDGKVSGDKDYDDLVFDDALAMVEEETQKPKLQMRRNKRSRYSEEVSPEMKKRLRQVSPGSSKSIAQSSQSHTSQADTRTPVIFVPDTCTVNLDDSHVEHGKINIVDKSKVKHLQKSAGSKSKVKSDSDGDVNTDFEVMVVPETLAMDVDSDLSEEDLHMDLESKTSDKNNKRGDMGKKKYEPELSDIKELSSENSGKEKSIKENRSSSQEKQRNNIKSKTDTKGTRKSDDNDGIKSSLRSLLNSPRSDDDLEADQCIRQAISSRDLDLDLDDSIVVSDEEDIRESQMNESKLTKRMCSIDKKSKALRMTEVDAMFETPEKRKSNISQDKKHMIDKKKTLFKKQLENDKPTLRRSPRKHGKNKTLDKKNEPEVDISPKGSKKESPSSRKIETFFRGNLNKSKNTNPINQEPQTIESQSMDEYNIIPVQNGVPQTNEMFQFKVAKGSKNGKKSSSKDKITSVSGQSNEKPIMKDVEPSVTSPSIIDTKSTGQTSDENYLLSPDAGCISDAESPLLLQSNKLRKSSQSSASQKQSSPNKTLNNKSKFSFKKPLAPKLRDIKKKTFVEERIEEDLDETIAPDKNLGAGVLDDVKDQRSNVTSEVNGSLDPAAELSIWCREPDTEASNREPAPTQSLTLPSLDDDFCMDDLHNDDNSLQRTSTLAVEESQDIPSSSTSYKFGPRKKMTRKLAEAGDVENIDPEPAISKLDDSFDRVPKKPQVKVAHVAVVRKQDERQKLQGHSCKQCLEYYEAAGLSEEEIKRHMQKCSRHRAEFVPPDTPPHFWSVGFIDTQECVDRGYMKVEKQTKAPPEEPSRFRRRRKLTKFFKSKNETSTVEPDSQEDL